MIKKKKVGGNVQTILDHYLKSQNIQAKTDIREEGNMILINFSLGEKQFASTTIRLQGNQMHVSARNSLGNSMWDMVQRAEKGVPQEMQNLFLHIINIWLLIFEQKKEIEVIFATVDASVFGDTAYFYADAGLPRYAVLIIAYYRSNCNGRCRKMRIRRIMGRKTVTVCR